MVGGPTPAPLIQNRLDYNLPIPPRISGPSMHKFSPRLEVLPLSQRKLWSELSAVPKEFVLYGGTALALHLGHRDSIDFNCLLATVNSISPSLKPDCRSCPVRR